VKPLKALVAISILFASLHGVAGGDPVQRQGDWIARNFKFHTGEVFPQLKLHYVTLGEPGGIPVLVLHGTGGSAATMLTPAFAGQLFGPGQPLDAAKYYIIIPDALGHGASAKPSDGLKTAFPAYDYADMVDAQYRLVSEGLHVRHLRLIIGNSMGGMNIWLWGERYPAFMDALVPMASQPTPMSSRNWMLRRMLVEMVRTDPAELKNAAVFFGIATAGGTLNYQKLAPTRLLADQLVDQRLAAPAPPDGTLLLIPASDQTSGHATTGNARFYADQLRALLEKVR
jgi:homoserine O-acetyltransferase